MKIKDFPPISGLFQRFQQKKDEDFNSVNHPKDYLSADELLTNDPDDELLVAYLDNELNDQERIEFQRRLEQSETFRQKLKELQSTWDMLDELEQSSLDPELTQSTLEMVAVDSEKQLMNQNKHYRWVLVQRGIFASVFLLLTFVLGNWTISMFLPDQNEQLKKDIPLLILLDQLEIVSDYDFLVQLKESGYFALSFSDIMTSDVPDSRFPNEPVFPLDSSRSAFNSVEKTADNPSKRSPYQAVSSSNNENSSENRWDKLLEIQNTDSSILLQDRDFFRKQQKFYRLISKEQNKIRFLYQKIVAAPDSDELLRILNHYYDWFRLELHEIQQDQILSIPSDKRFKLVERCYNETKFKKNRLARPKEGGPGDFQKKSAEMNSFGDPAFYPWRNNFYQASRNRNMIQELKKKIPAELRDENIDFLGDSFEISIQKAKDDDQFQKIDSKGRPLSFFELFLLENPLSSLISKFSENGQKYLNQLTENEQKTTIDLLLKINLFEKARKTDSYNPNRKVENDFRDPERRRNYRNNRNQLDEKNDLLNPEKNSEEVSFDSRRFQNLVPFSNDPQEPPSRLKEFDLSGKDFNARNLGKRGDAAGFFWKNESTQELAETLRNLPQERRDELLSLPSDEMYARLLMIHWGFAGPNEFKHFDNPPPFRGQPNPSR